MQKENKKQIDMLHGDIWNKILQFVIPVSATAILEQLFNASDIAVVGNFTGNLKTIAIASVGANAPLISLIVNLFIGIALGANVVIAQSIGKNNDAFVHKTVHTSIVFSLFGGILSTIVFELLASPILEILHVPTDVFPYALLYLRIYLLGLPVIFLYNFTAAIFRSIGDTKTPFITLACAGILNIILNLFFVIVFHMHVNGVAFATVISNICSAFILLYLLTKQHSLIHLDIHALHIDLEALYKILQIGLPAGIQSSVFSISNIVIQSAINQLGTVVIASSSAAGNIEIISYYVLNAFSQACTTFVGQNVGARKYDRCKKILQICLLEACITLTCTIAITLLIGKHLLALFNNTPEVIALGYTRLWIILCSYYFSGIYEIISGYLRGFGISIVPAILTMIGVCGVRILWIQLIFKQQKDFFTILQAYPISLCITAILLLFALFKYHPTKTRRLI